MGHGTSIAMRSSYFGNYAAIVFGPSPGEQMVENTKISTGQLRLPSGFRFTVYGELATDAANAQNDQMLTKSFSFSSSSLPKIEITEDSDSYSIELLARE